MPTDFRFKEFSVRQDRAAMKVGTDGVLLGAWVNLDGVKSVMDVGTGTGLISLMLTQRNEFINIRALEIDQDALEDAMFNFMLSPWSNRLFLTNTALQLFPRQQFDLIVSNPPFFEELSKSPSESRNKARNQEFLTVTSLIEYAVKSNSKRLVVIYPTEVLKELREACSENGWFINKLCFVKPTPSKPAKRIMVEMSSEVKKLVEEELVIEDKGRHQYSDAYIDLTKDFYLKM